MYIVSITMIGKVITYKPKDAYSRVLLHHTLFGRISSKTYRDKTTHYYKNGLLDRILFVKLEDSKIFVKDLEGIDIELLKLFGEITIEDSEQNDNIQMQTGYDYWNTIAIKRGILTKLPKRYKRS